jgi:hypothetical protein
MYIELPLYPYLFKDIHRMFHWEEISGMNAQLL